MTSLPVVGRFMEAELDLNDIIQEMHVIATIPELYHLLVELNAVHSLLGLLSHDNTDILQRSRVRVRLMIHGATLGNVAVNGQPGETQGPRSI